ncbi:hypothetical protein PsorP6_010906 [Peronosclerospora sorghi]|uniref:Uncharacterized protein n=1 Tax=Peronosclerospora sorghi TaxID=230839 RepID=A0ACC0VX60_9STRA|nr:hypothetical protein PsorP6_010906 [Peronosclerospora sorghi]
MGRDEFYTRRATCLSTFKCRSRVSRHAGAGGGADHGPFCRDTIFALTHTPRVQTRALAILSAAFQAFADVPCAPAPHEIVPVVATLLFALAEPHRALRQAAVACLAHWTEWAATSKSRNARVIVNAMRQVLHAKEELVMDATSVRVQCGSYS